jgi:uncharacterized cupin superfamily protein
MSKEEQTNIVRAEKAFEFRHAVTYPWNPGTIIAGANLDQMVGLTNTRIRVARLAPGNVASLYHSHTCEEEWIYILQGQILPAFRRRRPRTSCATRSRRA